MTKTKFTPEQKIQIVLESMYVTTATSMQAPTSERRYGLLASVSTNSSGRTRRSRTGTPSRSSRHSKRSTYGPVSLDPIRCRDCACRHLCGLQQPADPLCHRIHGTNRVCHAHHTENHAKTILFYGVHSILPDTTLVYSLCRMVGYIATDN